ncbi:peptide chain release factor N(5)-glutamine methyltransferase [Bartonella tamiae]|uniref:Release factor glutamine methyltransferase n=1 Tax=Bartonella tamiae Th239 TaxID=1094558 RepID=J0ZPH0_9HYPH|nr:peptide chain release factor N(5)-glutamine methyltransferase [Bartonella tamiae]EJF90473.1 protein-(glutamine-N5) methyltransferase, release factor-specific [Bartonella tamiae Th239]EJF93583.1 protein-(glutamine-N5) methyltransferase, release factor-specific [Bartonella tamiae Th307]
MMVETGSFLNELLQKTKKSLTKISRNEADREARLLVEWATQIRPIDHVLNPNLPISSHQMNVLEKAVEQRLKGMPVYRIIGMREFYGIPFLLSSQTLEPRSDTETLVDMVLTYLKNQNEFNQIVNILDMGTGTGAIAIAILSNFEKSRVWGVDVREDILETAFNNATNAQVSDRFKTVLSNWFENIDTKYDLIVSNPPYIPHDDIDKLSPEVKYHDPLRALDGGVDGLDFYRLLARDSHKFLKKNGKIAIEIGFGQEDAVISLFHTHGYHCEKQCKDLNAIPRSLLFRQ